MSNLNADFGITSSEKVSYPVQLRNTLGNYHYDRLETPIITGTLIKDNDDSGDECTHRGTHAKSNGDPSCDVKPAASVKRFLSKVSNCLGSSDKERKGRSRKKIEVIRVRSASAGRDRKTEMTSRYWSYLFDNLERAFSEIYDTCNKQENILQCQEALLVLENYSRDFNKLIEWLNIKWNYEQTPPPLRPNTLSWEIRKPSFSILPPTRLYEKIAALEECTLKFTDKDSLDNDPPNDDSLTETDATSSQIIQTSQIETVPSSSHGSPKLEEIPTLPVQTIDIGIQTDLEEDPDIYYFAGGRVIASQTDQCEQYGPLLPFSSNITPVIIVLNTSDSDMETSTTDNTDSTPLETDVLSNMTCPPSPINSREADLDISTNASIETKSSATQLSEGVIIDESAQGHSQRTPDSSENNTIVNKSSTVLVNGDAEEKAMPAPVPKPTTFADKAKNGMLRQAQTQAKSFPGNLNKIGEGQIVSNVSKSGSGTLAFSKVGKANLPGIIYRSNIASRYRTAMNTGQPPQVSPLKPKHSPPCTSSAVKTPITHVHVLASNTATVNANASTKSNFRDSSSDHGQLSRSSNKCPPPSPHHRPLLGNSKQSFGLGTVVPEKQKIVGGNSSMHQRLGVVRSKSMINPTLQRTNNNVSKSSGSQKQSGSVDQTPKESLVTKNKVEYAEEGKEFQRPHSNSFVSLPDETCNRKRNSIVDEDGWETVRARSNRSKWSPSSSSLYSSSANLSRNSSEKGINDARSGGSPQSVSPTSKIRKTNLENGGSEHSPPAAHSAGCSNSNPMSYFKSRFYSPSSTISLPVLASAFLEDDGSGEFNSSGKPESLKLDKKKSETENGSQSVSVKGKVSKVQTKYPAVNKKPIAIVATKTNKEKENTKPNNDDANSTTALANSRSHGGSSSSLSARPTKGSTSTEATIASKNKAKAPHPKVDTKGKNVKQSPASQTLTTNNKINGIGGVSKSQSTKTKITPPISTIIETQQKKSEVILDESNNAVEEEKGSSDKNNCSENKQLPSKEVNNKKVTLGESVLIDVSNVKEFVLTEDTLKKHNKLQSTSGQKEVCTLETPVGVTGGLQSASQWKEADDESSVDDEEIKRKEAALDSAIREEELLEEELRQVEKDFEMIENESSDHDGPDQDTISETAPSPDMLDTNEDPEVELEQFFFISMDDELSPSKAEEFVPREPGRIVTLREKLMSPAKRCDGAETLRKQQAKLANAERNREKLLQAKFNRYVELSDRFEALNETTKRLVEERTELIAKAEERRKRAVQKRKEYLKGIVRKAHDEDSKAKEIAFINCLEAQNRRHDYFASAQEIEERLQTMQEERKFKLEERATKASAVIERQFRIRIGWQAKLETLQEKRRKAEERITREKEERAKERSELAQEKARDREERISALNAAKQAEKEELQKKIIQKQEIHARRHEENMEQIRQKAIELSVPRAQEENSIPSSVRMCTLCKVTVQSEVQELAHLRGRAHLDAVKKIENLPPTSTLGMENFGLKFITDVQLDKIDVKIQIDKNRYKTLKKQCKKLMQKLTDSGMEFETKDKITRAENLRGDPSLKSKMQKNVREIDRLLGIFNAEKGTPALATSMDRLMGEIRKTCVRNKFVQEAAVGIGAVQVAQKVLECTASDLPVKVFISACHLLVGITYQNLLNTLYVFRSTCICAIMELCVNRWNALIPDGNRWLCGSPIGANEPLPSDSVIESIMELLFNVINVIPDPFVGILKEKILDNENFHDVLSRTLDVIGYLVASGVVDRLSVYCSGVRGPVDNQPSVAELLKVSLDFLTVNIYALSFCWEQKNNVNGSSGHKREPDTTQLLAALESSELAGAVSMSYSLLLYQGAPTRPRLTTSCSQMESLPSPPPPGERTASVVKTTLCLINAVARLDITALQNVLGSEAVSLQFRHIASQLLWQVVPHRADNNMRRLLNELLIAIGNFTVANKRNQVTIQSGQTPTVLQQLCCLPKEFFTDPKLSKTIIPTLIAATYGCPENREILVQQNINVALLDTFLHSDAGKLNCVTKRLIPPHLSGHTQSSVSSSNKRQKRLSKTGSVESDN